MTNTQRTDEQILNDFDEGMVSLSPNKGGFGGFYYGSKNGVELYDFDYMKEWIAGILKERPLHTPTDDSVVDWEKEFE